MTTRKFAQPYEARVRFRCCSLLVKAALNIRGIVFDELQYVLAWDIAFERFSEEILCICEPDKSTSVDYCRTTIVAIPDDVLVEPYTQGRGLYTSHALEQYYTKVTKVLRISIYLFLHLISLLHLFFLSSSSSVPAMPSNHLSIRFYN